MAEAAKAQAEELTEELRIRTAELDAVASKMTYEELRTLLSQHVFLPQEIFYDEILLLVNQTRLCGILPRDGVVYIAVMGEFSAAKTYVTAIAVFLAGGKFVVDPTEAALYGELILAPMVTLGIDEVDELMKKYIKN